MGLRELFDTINQIPMCYDHIVICAVGVARRLPALRRKLRWVTPAYFRFRVKPRTYS